MDVNDVITYAAADSSAGTQHRLLNFLAISILCLAKQSERCLDAIDCAYSEINPVTVIFCQFGVLIKAWGRNVNIEYNKRILICIPCGIIGHMFINYLLINQLLN